MKEKMKKLYFTNDFSLKNVQELQADGWIIRNAQLAKTDSFVEQADEYGGDVPERYKVQVEKITVSLNAEIAPELQKIIDDVKAESEMAVAENEELKEQLKMAVSQDAYDQVLQERTQLELTIESIKVDLESTSNERNTLSAQNADLQTAIDGLNKTIKSLEAKLKKQSVADSLPEQSKD